jgi:hypothetical protein
LQINYTSLYGAEVTSAPEKASKNALTKH